MLAEQCQCRNQGACSALQQIAKLKAPQLQLIPPRKIDVGAAEPEPVAAWTTSVGVQQSNVAHLGKSVEERPWVVREHREATRH